MKTTEFLALCESDPNQANRMIWEALGWNHRHGDVWDSPNPRGPTVHGPGYHTSLLPDYVRRLDAAWGPLDGTTSASITRSIEGSVGAHINIFDGRRTLQSYGGAIHDNPAHAICAAFLLARDKLSD